MAIGTVSCIINLIIFTKKNLRQSPYSIYFIAFNISNVLLIYSSILAMILDVGYDKSTLYTTVFCRLRMYAVFLFYSLSTQYLIMASIDRVLITSLNASTRRQSSSCLAFKCIFIGSIFWIIFHCHTLVLTDMIEIASNYYSCFFQPGFYSIFTGYFTAIFSLLVPILLAIFGLWTWKNLRSIRRVKLVFSQVGNRTNKTFKGISSPHSKDRQLILMLFIDSIIFVVCCPVYSVYLLYIQIRQHKTTNNEEGRIEELIRHVSLFLAYIPFCISCYTHLFISKTFRTEVKNIFKRQ